MNLEFPFKYRILSTIIIYTAIQLAEWDILGEQKAY